MVEYKGARAILPSTSKGKPVLSLTTRETNHTHLIEIYAITLICSHTLSQRQKEYTIFTQCKFTNKHKFKQLCGHYICFESLFLSLNFFSTHHTIYRCKQTAHYYHRPYLLSQPRAPSIFLIPCRRLKNTHSTHEKNTKPHSNCNTHRNETTHGLCAISQSSRVPTEFRSKRPIFQN